MTTIDEVLAKEAAGWATLQEAVASVPEDRRSEGDVVPGWTVQVLLWHSIYWADYVGQVVEAAAAGRPAPGDEDWDALNDQVASDGAAMSWDEVVAGGERARARVRDAIASLRPELLTGDLLGEISGETWEHYEEHAAEIAAFAAG